MELNKIISEKQKNHLEKLRYFHLGRKRSIETRQKISQALKGKRLGLKRPEHSKWMKKHHPKGMLGKKHSGKTKLKMSNSWCYEKIITPERNKQLSETLKLKYGTKNTDRKYLKNLIRKSAEYRNWRKSVFERDKYTCQECGAKNGNGKAVYLEAHHIKSFVLFPDLRFKVSNGLTLCRQCHLSIL